MYKAVCRSLLSWRCPSSSSSHIPLPHGSPGLPCSVAFSPHPVLELLNLLYLDTSCCPLSQYHGHTGLELHTAPGLTCRPAVWVGSAGPWALGSNQGVAGLRSSGEALGKGLLPDPSGGWQCVWLKARPRFLPLAAQVGGDFLSAQGACISGTSNRISHVLNLRPERTPSFFRAYLLRSGLPRWVISFASGWLWHSVTSPQGAAICSRALASCRHLCQEWALRAIFELCLQDPVSCC